MIPPKLRRLLPFLIVVASLALLSGTGFAQEEAAAPAHADKSIVKQIMEGGPLIVFIWLCIIGTSVTMVTLIIQNAMSLKKSKLAPPPLVEALRQTLESGNYQEAWATCAANKNYLANVLKAGTFAASAAARKRWKTPSPNTVLREATVHPHAQQLPLGHRRHQPHDRAARHGHRNDGCLRSAWIRAGMKDPARARGENRLKCSSPRRAVSSSRSRHSFRTTSSATSRRCVIVHADDVVNTLTHGHSVR